MFNALEKMMKKNKSPNDAGGLPKTRRIKTLEVPDLWAGKSGTLQFFPAAGAGLLGLTPVLEEDAGFKPGFPLAHSFWELTGGLTWLGGIASAFVLDACSLMAASLSSAQPVKPRKQKLSRATLNPQVNNLMMSLTLLKKSSAKMKTDVTGSENVILDRYVLGWNDQPAENVTSRILAAGQRRSTTIRLNYTQQVRGRRFHGCSRVVECTIQAKG